MVTLSLSSAATDFSLERYLDGLRFSYERVPAAAPADRELFLSSGAVTTSTVLVYETTTPDGSATTAYLGQAGFVSPHGDLSFTPAATLEADNGAALSAALSAFLTKDYDAAAHALFAGADTMFGGNAGDELASYGGADRVYAAGGDDVIAGGSGADVLVGGDGDDHITGGVGADRIFGGSGLDMMYGGGGDDVIVGGDSDPIASGTELLSGGAGDDLLRVGSGLKAASGGAGDDRILGGEGSGTLSGNSGDDTIVGGAGQYAILGDTGNDRLVVGDLGGMVDGGAGDDHIVGGQTAAFLSGSYGEDTIVTYGVSDMITGGASGGGVDTIVIAGDVDGQAPTILDFFGFRPDDNRMEVIALVGDVFQGLGGAVTDENFVVGTQASDADDRLIFDPTHGNLFYDPDGNGEAAAQLIAIVGPHTGEALRPADFIVV